MKVLIILGTRPEAIKLAPVILELEKKSCFSIAVCSTGQHKEMLQQVLDLFGIQPKYNLGVMTHDQGLNELSSSLLGKISAVIDDCNPEWILVQGDTTTAMISSIAAMNKKVKVGHVEAGLRSGNLSSPWPEEANRKIIGSIASAHFAPTKISSEALLSENINQDDILITGNTVIDALMLVSNKMDSSREMQEELDQKFAYLDLTKRLILVTGHRRESWGDGQRSIFLGLRSIAKRGDVQVIYPVHMNPNVKVLADDVLGDADNVFLVDPVDYCSLIYLMRRCYLIVTDSGGIQEEAPTFSKPILVTRNETERQEGIDAGTAKLIGSNGGVLLQQVNLLLDDASYYKSFCHSVNPYGDGCAAERIVEFYNKKISNEVGDGVLT
jgi:UDP-N-acetylglucosamine 2-epimerase (non-hydrolysing)